MTKQCIDCHSCGIVTTMRETIELGPSPVGENCAQLGADDYAERAMRECSAYMNQLRRVYEQEHGKNIPESCRLKIKANSHDFGTYYEVAIVFDDSDQVAIEAAFWLEGNTPTQWDAEARKELQL